MHTAFSQAVAATGRLSSSDPNLQNIPIRTEIGPRDPPRLHRRARRRADLGRLLADRAARAGAPVRRRDADRGVRARRRHPRSDRAQGVRRRQRPRSRTSCGGAPRSSTTRCSTARRRSRSPRTSACRSRRRSSSSTPTSPASRACAASSTRRSPTRGERRRDDDVRPAAAGAGVTSRNGQIRAAAERVAVNMPIQGTAADILKRAMIDVHARARPDRSAARAHDPDRARRAAVRGAGGCGRRGRGARQAQMEAR